MQVRGCSTDLILQWVAMQWSKILYKGNSRLVGNYLSYGEWCKNITGVKILLRLQAVNMMNGAVESYNVI